MYTITKQINGIKHYVSAMEPDQYVMDIKKALKLKTKVLTLSPNEQYESI